MENKKIDFITHEAECNRYVRIIKWLITVIIVMIICASVGVAWFVTNYGVEQTTTTTENEVSQETGDNGTNNYVNGDNNEVNNG